MKTYLRILKLNLLLISGIFLSHHAQAQFVVIPDTNFVAILKIYGYGGCFDTLNRLDTTCQSILNARYINFSYLHISDLTGIQYFKNLDSLRCNADTTLTNIPALPPHLKVFECRNNYLDSLPPLPDSLVRFTCDFNHLSKLPALPPTLHFLSCLNNQLITLPNLPVSLKVLYCSGNHLLTLPTTLPDSLLLLSCYSNSLSSIPALPNGLQQLLCSQNLLTALPALPNALVYLDCYSNQLSTLPALPNGLNYLGCNKNNLSSLPALPNSLTGINCEHNRLGSLPDLPDSLNILFCDNNPNLHCLPLLKTIGDLEFYSTGIQCTPNYGNVGASSPALSALPLCEVGNTYGCLVVSGIQEVDKPWVAVYPNPANDMVTVTVDESYKQGTCRLLDINGREILKQKITAQQFQVAINNLPAGLYLINISGTGMQSYTGKLAVK